MPPATGNVVNDETAEPNRPDDRDAVKLENDRYLVEVSRANGRITRIFDKIGKLDLIGEPRLADNFKFTLPLPGKEPWETIEANYILGKDQPLGSCEVQGRRLTLHWAEAAASPHRREVRRSGDYGDRVGRRIRAVHPADRQSNAVSNRRGLLPHPRRREGAGQQVRRSETDPTVAAGGDRHRNDNPIRALHEFRRLWRPGAGTVLSLSQGPSRAVDGPVRPQAAPRRVLGLARSCQSFARVRLEMLPGISQTPRGDGNWPRRAELNGLPAGVLFLWSISPIILPARSTSRAVGLQFHNGGWQEAEKIYAKRKGTSGAR